MHHKIILAGLCALLSAAGTARAQNTAFTYQGRLNSATGAATGLYDISFTLYATSGGGSALAVSNGVVAVPVTNGLFTVALNFGSSPFAGADRWLEIAVRTNGTGSYAVLTPRQPLTPTPYAIRAISAGTAATAGTATNVVASGIIGASIATNVVDSSKITDGTIAATDLSVALLSNTFWRLTGNAGTSPGVNFIGTTDGQALRIQAPRVGINTATPRGPLEVNTGAGSIIFRNEDNVAPGITVSNSPNEGVLRFRHRLEVWPNPSATEFGTLDVRETNGAVMIRLPARGNGYFLNGPIGIGTATPENALLDLEGVLRMNNNEIALGAFSETGSGLGTRQTFADQFINGVALYGHNGGILGTQFDENNVNSQRWSLKWNHLGNVFVNSNLFVNTSVGIGTTSPLEKLHVAGKFLRVDGLGDERAYLGGDGIGGEVQVGSLNPAINNVLLWNAGNNTTMDLIANQVTASQFNGPLNGSLSGTFSGGVSASTLKVGTSSTPGSVLTATDSLGNTRWESSLRIERTGNPPLFTAPNILAGYSGNAASNGVVGGTVSGGGALGLATGPNFVGGNYASVSGGFDNIAGGNYATVLGGNGNRAQGLYSGAAGRRAKANHQGTFVWADSQNSDFASTANNQFLIRALFGVGINTPSPTPGFSLDVNGDTQTRDSLVVDGDNSNAGGLYPGLGFGSNSGEGISSRRTSGDNQYGLDFYTASTRRFSIRLDGGMNLHDNTLGLRGTTDANHGLGFRSTFATHNVDGPALYGYAGGALGTTEGGENWSLRWDKNEVKVKVLTITGGMDLAEPFTMKEEAIEPGSVVVIDDEHPGRLKLSGQAYDTRVAGIVSGAGGVKPGIALHQEGIQEGGQNVALSGRVYVKADASNGAIRPGDLLTTSERPGHAMKVDESGRVQGAILGKAMTALKEGTGLVLVLVTLQ